MPSFGRVPWRRVSPSTDLQIRRTAARYDLPASVLAGVLLIERHFRPVWVRLLEDGYLFLRLSLWALCRVAVPNVSVGSFQVGVAVALNVLGFVANRHVDYVRPPSTFAWLVLWRLPMWATNLELAARVLAEYYSRTEGLDSARRIRMTGFLYNGSAQYGRVLAELSEALEFRQRSSRGTPPEVEKVVTPDGLRPNKPSDASG